MHVSDTTVKAIHAGKKAAVVSLHESQNITNEIDKSPTAAGADDAERMPSALDFLNAQQGEPMEVLPSLADCLAVQAAATPEIGRAHV